ncbi:MAG: Rossman fold protein, TIGR00730 family [Chloroflexi bacterium GWB2_54_36]|nr:MAG: Rossman fold protein, TIGR00730 family [Chloroflexi bacterium GWB2_54_36]
MYKSICVYCGSADGLDKVYLDAARAIGQIMAERGIELVYGAGKTGMMGALADGVLAAGGQVTGVVPDNLNQPQLIHAGLTHLEVVGDIHQRKARMSQLAEAFIALPGGYGTLDELFETLTWAQIGLHTKPVGLLNTREYFSPLLQMIERARSEKFIYDEHRDLLVYSSDPQDLLLQLENFKVPTGLERWVNR